MQAGQPGPGKRTSIGKARLEVATYLVQGIVHKHGRRGETDRVNLSNVSLAGFASTLVRPQSCFGDEPLKIVYLSVPKYWDRFHFISVYERVLYLGTEW